MVGALVRASDTSPILVTRFEAKTKRGFKILQEEIAKVIELAKRVLLKVAV